MKGTYPLQNPCSNPTLSFFTYIAEGLSARNTISSTHGFFMAERVGFEPTVPLPRRMLSKHVDSSTLAPLRQSIEEGSLACTPMSGKAR